MRPTEHETTVAIEAAAKYVYEQGRGQHNAQIESATGAHTFFQPAKLPAWEDLEQTSRNIAMDEMTGPVWAALVALPDRLHAWRQLIDEVDVKDIIQLQQFHTQIKETLHATPR